MYVWFLKKKVIQSFWFPQVYQKNISSTLCRSYNYTKGLRPTSLNRDKALINGVLHLNKLTQGHFVPYLVYNGTLVLEKYFKSFRFIYTIF